MSACVSVSRYAGWDGLACLPACCCSCCSVPPCATTHTNRTQARPPPPAAAGQALSLVLYTAVGLASTALVLSITVPSVGNWWYAMCAVAPAAGAYYWKNAERTEEFKVGVLGGGCKVCGVVRVCVVGVGMVWCLCVWCGAGCLWAWSSSRLCADATLSLLTTGCGGAAFRTTATSMLHALTLRPPCAHARSPV